MLVRQPEYDDGDILTTSDVADVFGVSTNVRRWVMSPARSRNVSLATVIDAAEKGDLRRIVEMRDFGAQRKIEQRNTARIAHMYRQRLHGIWLERDLWLRERGV